HPEVHSADATVVSFKAFDVSTADYFLSTFDAKISAQNANGNYNIDFMEPITVPVDKRAFRPYPPACVKINDSHFPTATSGPLTITWKIRDRHNLNPKGWYLDEDDIDYEAGTTVSAYVYEGETLKDS